MQKSVVMIEMKRDNRWMEGTKGQWIFCTYDNSHMEGLEEKVEINKIYFPPYGNPKNMGIHKYNNQIYSSNFVGVSRLKNLDGNNIKANDGKDVIIKIEPRFPISVLEMLNIIKDDDEFERYLAPQTVKIDSSEIDVEDLGSNEIFHFFDKEAPIFINDDIARDSSILTATLFISMLKDLCRRPLIGRMISIEENLVGKVKGKIVFSKNIRLNSTRGRDDRLYCKYLRYSEDILENQILKSALIKSNQFLNKYFAGVNSKNNTYKEMVTYCQKSLNHISNNKISTKDTIGVKTTGLYAYYKPVISVARMVLSEITLESRGTSKFTGYVVPYAVSMSNLFEMYSRAYLKHSGVKSYLSEEEGIHMLKYDDKSRVFDNASMLSANYINGNMKPDIILKNSDNNKTMVFDVKYKDLSNKRYARDDRLQLLAYCLMYNCNDIGIIFPSLDGEKSLYYDKNQISTTEPRERYYHQIRLNINKGWDTNIFSKTDNTRKDIYEYLSSILS